MQVREYCSVSRMLKPLHLHACTSSFSEATHRETRYINTSAETRLRQRTARKMTTKCPVTLDWRQCDCLFWIMWRNNGCFLTEWHPLREDGVMKGRRTSCKLNVPRSTKNRNLFECPRITDLFRFSSSCLCADRSAGGVAKRPCPHSFPSLLAWYSLTGSCPPALGCWSGPLRSEYSLTGGHWMHLIVCSDNLRLCSAF